MNVKEIPDKDYLIFTEKFEKLSGIQLQLYKEKQMKRRINTLINRKQLKGYDEFLMLLQSNSSELSDFLDYITINVTEFFRTPEQWISFEDIVIKHLNDVDREELRIWSCACSTGEEAYSLAMSFLENMDLPNFHIIATDVNERVLAQARTGIYSEDKIASVSEKLKEHYFETDGKNYTVVDHVKNYIEFKKLDLLEDSYPDNIDLIVCRNVMIYLTDKAKNSIYCKFFDSLKPGGYLFTGNTEQIIYYKHYKYQKITNFLYQKKLEDKRRVERI